MRLPPQRASSNKRTLNRREQKIKYIHIYTRIRVYIRHRVWCDHKMRGGSVWKELLMLSGKSYLAELENWIALWNWKVDGRHCHFEYLTYILDHYHLLPPLFEWKLKWSYVQPIQVPHPFPSQPIKSLKLGNFLAFKISPGKFIRSRPLYYVYAHLNTLQETQKHSEESWRWCAKSFPEMIEILN